MTIHKMSETTTLTKSPTGLFESSFSGSWARRKNLNLGLLNFKLKMFTSFFFPSKFTK